MEKNLTFVSVAGLLEDKGMEMPAFQCINSDPATFRLLKMQPQANFQYDEKAGPRCTDNQLTEKCRSALQLARAECADLVLFPEYCMPYSLLWEVLSDTEQWPDQNKLWCLPCQAIRHDDFFAFLTDAGKKENVVVLGRDHCRDPGLQRRFFVNALFYCFTVYQGDTQKLVLLPQLKLHPMRDPAYLCEGDGLTTGSLLYYFMGEHICLLSLICADVYHMGVSWPALYEVSGHRPLFLLHPQLNGNPREHAFSMLRRNMMDHNEPGLYITCNWAAGTDLTPSGGGNGTLRIDLSWSCVYRKYDMLATEAQLYGDNGDRAKNLKWGLCTGVIPQCRTAVWFTDSQETLHIFRLAAVHASGYPVVNRYQACQAVGRYTVSTDSTNAEPRWEQQEYIFSLAEQLTRVPDLTHLSKPLFYGQSVLRLSTGEIPFRSSSKDDVDHFFALASALRQHPLALDGVTEVPIAWTLFLNDDDVSNADKALNHFLKLCRSLEEDLPPHLQELRGQLQFVYLPPEHGDPPANLQSTDSEHRRMLVAFADTEYEAKIYLQYLKKQVLHENEPDGRFVCVFYHEPLRSTVNSFPKAETQITHGDAFQPISSITNGGADD